MEGLIPFKRVDQFRDKIKEGAIYSMERFNLYDAKRLYRAVDHALRICVTQRTMVTEVFPHPSGFPRLAYSALPFTALLNRAEQNTVMLSQSLRHFFVLCCASCCDVYLWSYDCACRRGWVDHFSL